jgi:hypothetical protein
MKAKTGLAAVVLTAVLIGCLSGPLPSSSPTATAPAATGSPSAQGSSTPSATATVTPIVPTATAVPLPTATSPATSTAPPATAAEPTPSLAPPTPGANGWVGSDQVAEGQYLDVALVLDASGVAHVAAQGKSGIWHLTNASGDWTRERLTTTARHEVHDSVAIALDDSDGSLWVAYAQRRDDLAPNFSSAVAYVTNKSGPWSQPIDIPGSSELQALAVTGGAIHLASNDQQAEDAEDLSDIFRPLYITNGGGNWAAVPVAERGYNLALRLAPDGRVDLIMESWQPGTDVSTIYQATRAAGAGSFDLQPIIEGLPLYESQEVGALDPTGVPHLFLSQGFPVTATYVRGLGGSQTEPEGVPIMPGSIAFDAQVALHGVDGDRYVTNVGGSFAAQNLACGCEPNDAGIAVDAGGRPHVVLSSRDGIWYTFGPAQ